MFFTEKYDVVVAEVRAYYDFAEVIYDVLFDHEEATMMYIKQVDNEFVEETLDGYECTGYRHRCVVELQRDEEGNFDVEELKSAIELKLADEYVQRVREYKKPVSENVAIGWLCEIEDMQAPVVMEMPEGEGGEPQGTEGQ